MEEMGVVDYTAVRIDCEGEDVCFGGLQRVDSRVKIDALTFLDGCCDDHEACSFAVGTEGVHISGPRGTVKCVELFVIQNDLGAEAVFAEGGTSPENPYCEHGRSKEQRTCVQCKDPLAGHHMVDHAPYIPCTPGHGPRWLWDISQRGSTKKHLSSNRFWEQLTEQRSFRREKWPMLFLPEYPQDGCSGLSLNFIDSVSHFSELLPLCAWQDTSPWCTMGCAFRVG